jgi:MFS family permease
VNTATARQVVGGWPLLRRERRGAGQGRGRDQQPLIVDYVADRRGGVLALASMGATLAALAAGAFGSAGVVERFGWRGFFIGSGIFGVVFAAAFAAIVREPPRGWSEGRTQQPSASATPREIVALVCGRARPDTFAGTALNTSPCSPSRSGWWCSSSGRMACRTLRRPER